MLNLNAYLYQQQIPILSNVSCNNTNSGESNGIKLKAYLTICLYIL